MKKIFITILILVFNFGFAQINGTYKSKDGLYKLKISNYSKQDKAFNFVWEALNPDDLCSCGGEGYAQEDDYEPKNGEFVLIADSQGGGFDIILQFKFKPNNIIDVKVVGDINNLWGCGRGCPIRNETFYKVLPKKTAKKKK